MPVYEIIIEHEGNGRSWGLPVDNGRAEAAAQVELGQGDAGRLAEPDHDSVTVPA